MPRFTLSKQSAFGADARPECHGDLASSEPPTLPAELHGDVVIGDPARVPAELHGDQVIFDPVRVGPKTASALSPLAA